MRQTLEIVNAVNRDSVGLTVDCINVYLHDKCADVDFIRKFLARSCSCSHQQLRRPCRSASSTTVTVWMPGLGAIPVQKVADAVQAVGYDGFMRASAVPSGILRMPAEDVIRMGGNHPSVPRLIF